MDGIAACITAWQWLLNSLSSVADKLTDTLPTWAPAQGLSALPASERDPHFSSVRLPHDLTRRASGLMQRDPRRCPDAAINA